MNVSDMILTIHQMDRADVDRVLEAAKLRREWLSRTSIRIGDTVQFNAKSRGIQTGKVIKINPTRIKVNCGTVTWNVSPTLLTRVDVNKVGCP